MFSGERCKTQKMRGQEVDTYQSWIFCPTHMTAKHCKQVFRELLVVKRSNMWTPLTLRYQAPCSVNRAQSLPRPTDALQSPRFAHGPRPCLPKILAKEVATFSKRLMTRAGFPRLTSPAHHENYASESAVQNWICQGLDLQRFAPPPLPSNPPPQQVCLLRGGLAVAFFPLVALQEGHGVHNMRICYRTYAECSDAL